ncbi:MAG: P-loop NTPase [Bacteroidales bacterium]
MINGQSIRIAIASGKGGTGKTLISTSLFYALQHQNVPVTLVDCDAEEPNDMVFFSGDKEKTTNVTQLVPIIDENKCTYCGKCHDYCSYKAIFIIPPSKIIKVMEDLCHGCGACSVACEFGAITEKEVSLGEVNSYAITQHSKIIESRIRVGVYSPVSVIKAAIKETGKTNVILMDSPPGTSCPFIQTVNHADYVILVTEPTPFGLSDLKQSVDTLKTMGKPCGVIINRAGMGDNEVYKYLKDNAIPLLLEIPFDREIASIYSKGNLVAKEKPELQEQLHAVFNEIKEKTWKLQ